MPRHQLPIHNGRLTFHPFHEPTDRPGQLQRQRLPLSRVYPDTSSTPCAVQLRQALPFPHFRIISAIHVLSLFQGAFCHDHERCWQPTPPLQRCSRGLPGALTRPRSFPLQVPQRYPELITPTPTFFFLTLLNSTKHAVTVAIPAIAIATSNVPSKLFAYAANTRGSLSDGTNVFNPVAPAIIIWIGESDGPMTCI